MVEATPVSPKRCIRDNLSGKHCGMESEKPPLEKCEIVLVGSKLNDARKAEVNASGSTLSSRHGYAVFAFPSTAATERSLVDAVVSAQNTGVEIKRIEPDPLVTLADIAGRTGLSRASLTYYAKGQRREGFPRPCARLTSNSPMWDWADVAAWLFERGRVSKEAAKQAMILSAANEALQDFGDFKTNLEKRLKAREGRL